MTDNTELKRLAEAATQGEWQVIETELPCRIGRPHVERRIFTAKDHPQLKAPYPVVNGSVALGTDETPVHHMVSMTAEDAAYIAAANPAAILALLAENEELGRYLCTCRDCGGEGALHTGDWHSYGHMEPPEPVMEKCGECDGTGLLGEIQDLYQVITERDQLRTEVAGLKAGYEAYERVNAELEAEVEALRKYGEEFAVLAERRREEADALRKDSESYRLLSFCHGQGTLELVRSHHELCTEIRRLKILAGEPVPPTPEEFIGPSPEGPTARIRRKLAAMGKGEQS